MGKKYQVSPEYMESLIKVLVEMEEKGELQKSLDPEKYQEIIDILTKEGKINRPQKIDKINAIIENDKLTHDVLYGNTPMDMLSRAGSNEEIKILTEDDVVLKELYIKLTHLITKDQPEDVYRIGKIVLILSIFKKIKTEESLNLMEDLLHKAPDDSLIYRLTSIVANDIKEEKKIKLFEIAYPIKVSEDGKQCVDANGRIWHERSNAYDDEKSWFSPFTEEERQHNLEAGLKGSESFVRILRKTDDFFKPKK